MHIMVQVFIPNYNGEKYICNTIASILNQSYQNFELNIVDNNSKDNSIDLVKSFNDQRIKIHKFDETVSIGENFNRCLKLVTADYFFLAHSDDIYEHSYISEMIEAFNFSPNSLMAHSNFNCINNIGEIYNNPKYQIKEKMFTSDRFLIRHPSEELKDLICGNYIICPSMFFKRDVLKFIGYFNNNYTFALDWDYSLRILQNKYSIIRVSKKIINYRISDINTTIRAVSSNIKYEEHLSIIYRYKSIVENKIFKKSRSRLSKIIMWDIKEDLLNKNYTAALNKYRFLRNKKLLKLYVLYILKIILSFKSFGGNILNVIAKMITYSNKL